MSRLLIDLTTPMDGDYVDWAAEIDAHGHKLPHWQQGEAMQFVTFRLADSLPQPLLNRWKDERDTWLELHPEPWTEETEAEYHRRFSAQLGRWLDQGMGACLLQDGANRERVEEALMKFHGERVDHHSWVIMPNHVHLLFTPRVPLDQLLKAWKGVSSRSLGDGKIWQANYRDTLVRNEPHFRNAVRYIRKNPRWANLRPGDYTLWESDRARQIPDTAE